VQLDRYVILPLGCTCSRRTLRGALAHEGWAAVWAREWPSPVLLEEDAAVELGDVVLASPSGSPMAARLRELATSDAAASLFFLNYDERIEGARLTDSLTGAEAHTICPEHGGSDLLLWNVQPHGGRDLFFATLASCLARLGAGTVLDPYARRASNGHWRRLVHASLHNALAVQPAR
jgi:hypothetical protein